MLNAYNIVMAAIKRIPVSESIWKELSEMRRAGQTYDELLAELVDRVKKARLADDIRSLEEESEFVSIREITP
jgi:predicted CopG family antitoxin